MSQFRTVRQPPAQPPARSRSQPGTTGTSSTFRKGLSGTDMMRHGEAVGAQGWENTTANWVQHGEHGGNPYEQHSIPATARHPHPGGSPSSSGPAVASPPPRVPMSRSRASSNGPLPRNRRSGSPTSTALSNSSRVEAAHKKLLEQLARHEREYDRALRVKQTEIMTQQHKLDQLQEHIYQEEQAAERAKKHKEARQAKQHRENVRKLTVLQRADHIQQAKIEELLSEEQAEQERQQKIQAQKRIEEHRSQREAEQRDEHRADVLYRNSLIQQAKRNDITTKLNDDHHARNKQRRLLERRKSLAERNAAKEDRHRAARQLQEEEQERMRWEFESREAERREVNAEIKWMDEQIARDRAELEMAIQRLRSSKY